MADSTIDSELIYLINPWGPPNTEPSLLDDIIGAQHHNVEEAFFPIGSVVNLWNDSGDAGKDGWSQFVYLQIELTGAPTSAAKQVVVPDSATVWYIVTNDPDDCIKADGSALFGVTLSVMTDAYYGWYWCGGVCPEGRVSDLAGNFATESNVLAGMIATSDLADADAIGFGPVAADTEAGCGFALADDA